ncbi:MAG: YHS domain-containing protein [Candidatus Caldarchaeum sp.]|uniref:YHS domain-containing protein n=1 Tax=Caldiarchaeum subterraneum TaxID=311458 RepID=A0A7C5U621_CALS0
MAVDPVCNMKVDESKAKFTSVYGAKTIYFCSAHCKQVFDKDPAKYVK